MQKFIIPEWFYLPENGQNKISTTAAQFDANKVAWVTTVEPNSARKKKQVLVADWTLEQEKIDLVKLLEFLQQLLKADFQVYIATVTGPLKITPVNLALVNFFDIPPYHQQDLIAKMNVYGISADELIILDAITIFELEKINPILRKTDYNEANMQAVRMACDVVRASYDWNAILLALGKNDIIACSSMGLAGFNRIAFEIRQNITQINITDARFLSNYIELERIFPNLEKIYLPISAYQDLSIFITDPKCTGKIFMYNDANTYGKNSIGRYIDWNDKKNAGYLGYLTIRQLDFIAKYNIKLIDCYSMQALNQINLLNENQNAFNPSVAKYLTENNLKIEQALILDPEKLIKYSAPIFPEKTKIHINFRNFTNYYLGQLSNEQAKAEVITSIINEPTYDLTQVSWYALEQGASLINFLKIAPNLRRLTDFFIRDNVTPEVSNNELLKLDNLEEIEFSSPRLITILLKKAPNLRKILFGSSSIDINDIVMDLSGVNLAQLKELHFNNITINLLNLISILQIAPNLKHILLVDIKFSVNIAIDLTGFMFNKLEELNLSQTEIPAKNLASILQVAPNLRKINLGWCRRIEGIVTDLIDLKLEKLEELALSYTEMAAKNLQNILQATPNLRKLVLKCYKNIDASTIELDNLKFLNLEEIEYYEVMNYHVDFYKLLITAPNLRKINLGHMVITNLEEIELPNIKFNNLTEIKLNCCLISEKSLANLFEMAPNLKVLHIQKCNLKDLFEIDRYNFKLKNLQEITISGDAKTINLTNFIKFIKHANKLKKIEFLSWVTLDSELVELENINFNFSDLEEISLEYINIPETIFKKILTQTKCLKKINFRSSNLVNIDFSNLTLHNLAVLDLSYTTISAENIRILFQKAKILRKINLRGAKIIDMAALNLSDIKLLDLLDMDLSYPKLNIADLIVFLQVAPNLKTLALNPKDYNLTNLGESACFPNLMKLVIDNDAFCSERKKANLYAVLQYFPNLQELHYQKEFYFYHQNLDEKLSVLCKYFDFDGLPSIASPIFRNQTQDITRYHDLNVRSEIAGRVFRNQPPAITRYNHLNTSLEIAHPAFGQHPIAISKKKHPFKKALDINVAYKRKNYIVKVGEIIPILTATTSFAEAREHIYNIEYDSKEIIRKEIQPTVFNEVTDVIPKFCNNLADLKPNQKLIRLAQAQGFELYQTTQEFMMQANTTYKLYSLTAAEKLQELKIVLQNSNPPRPNIKITRSPNNNFYYLESDIKCIITAIGMLAVPPAQKPYLRNQYLTQLFAEFEKFQQPSEDLDVELKLKANASSIDKLEAIYEQHLGSCRHRVAAFLYQIDKLKEAGKIPVYVEALGAKGPRHTWIELRENSDQPWQTLDLGGYIGHSTKYEQTADPVLKYISERSLIGSAISNSEATNLENYPKLDIVTGQIIGMANDQDLQAQLFANDFKQQSVRDLKTFLTTLVQNKSGNRILLATKNSAILEQMRQVLLIQMLLADHQVFTADACADLISSKPTLKIAGLKSNSWSMQAPPSGKLVAFLATPHKTKVILVDWSKFTAAEMVRVNSLIDDQGRQVEGQAIAADITILGLINRDLTVAAADFLTDNSFTSRHDEIIDIPFNEAELQVELENLRQKLDQKHNLANQATEIITTAAPIDLYNSANWQNLLLGLCSINQGKPFWQKTAFVQAFEAGQTIRIKNAPLQDPQFVRFIADIRNCGTLNCYGEQIASNSKIICDEQQDYNFSDLIACVADINFNILTNQLDPRAFLVNSAIFERCFINESVQKNPITLNEELIRTDGWLQLHKNASLELFLTSNLNLQQWSLLLTHAKLLNIKLSIKLAPKVVLPRELAEVLKTQITQAVALETKALAENVAHNICIAAGSADYIIADDVDFVAKNIAKAQHHKNPIIIDVSELSDEDLLYSNGFEFTKVGVFKFKERISAIWQALQQKNRLVILKGRLSASLLGHLGSLFIKPSGYLWHQAEKQNFAGHLILVTKPDQEDSDFIANKIIYNTSISEKKAFLLQELNLSETELLDLFPDYQSNATLLWQQSFSKISQIISFAKRCKAQEQLDFELKTTTKFSYKIKDIATASKVTLDFPEISSSTRDFTNNSKDYEEWLKTDRAEIRNLPLSITDCIEFAQQRIAAVDFMLSWSPYVYLEGAAGTGKSSFIREYCALGNKKVFNQQEIQQWAECTDGSEMKLLVIDEANLADTDWTQFSGLFNKPPFIIIKGKYYKLTDKHKIIFAGNPVNYGADRNEPSLFVENPAKIKFPAMSAAYIRHKILLPILKTMYSTAEAEDLSLYILSKYKLSDFVAPEKSGITVRDLQYDAIKYCALKQQQQHHHATQQQAFSDVPEDAYVITNSRARVDLELTQLLQVARFRQYIQTVNKQASDAIIYGGKNALLLNGPPGTGKSEFIKYALKKHGYNKEISISNHNDLPTENSYYAIPASCSLDLKLKLLEKAFQAGALVVMEEINSNKALERYINAYLMGEDENGNRPKKPGFSLLASYNSATLKGRRILSPAIKSRSVNCEITECNKAELMQILTVKTKGQLSAELLQFIVEEFLFQQVTAKTNHSLLMPTFRDLLRNTKQYIQKLIDFKQQFPTFKFDLAIYKQLFCMNAAETLRFVLKLHEQLKEQAAIQQQQLMLPQPDVTASSPLLTQLPARPDAVQPVVGNTIPASKTHKNQAGGPGPQNPPS